MTGWFSSGGGFCPGGIMSGGVFVQVVFVRVVFVRGVFCPYTTVNMVRGHTCNRNVIGYILLDTLLLLLCLWIKVLLLLLRTQVCNLLLLLLLHITITPCLPITLSCSLFGWSFLFGEIQEVVLLTVLTCAAIHVNMYCILSIIS